MSIFLGLLILIICIVLIYQYSKLFSKNTQTSQKGDDIEEFFSNKASVRNKYGIPLPEYRENNVAYISVIANGVLDIYKYNSTNKSQEYILEVDIYNRRLKRINSDKVNFFHTPFNYYNGDRLMFYNKSTKGLCYWAGHIFYNNQFYFFQLHQSF